MNNWDILLKELSYYGIKPINIKMCQVYDQEGNLKTQGVVQTIKSISKDIKFQKSILNKLWHNGISLLDEVSFNTEYILAEKSKKLFIRTLKDMLIFLDCFDDLDDSPLKEKIEKYLNRDINEFSPEQISKLPDYKISIDWTHRLICKLIYVKKLLSLISLGKNNVMKYEVKTARGVAGPWSRLDIPQQERVFPFGFEVQERSKQKERQRRYRKGFDDYNSQNVSEGHYWRELRNEPYSWYDRKYEDPYPHRQLLN